MIFHLEAFAFQTWRLFLVSFNRSLPADRSAVAWLASLTLLLPTFCQWASTRCPTRSAALVHFQSVSSSPIVADWVLRCLAPCSASAARAASSAILSTIWFPIARLFDPFPSVLSESSVQFSVDLLLCHGWLLGCEDWKGFTIFECLWGNLWEVWSSCLDGRKSTEDGNFGMIVLNDEFLLAFIYLFLKE